jgi:hypothetical protein
MLSSKSVRCSSIWLGAVVALAVSFALERRAVAQVNAGAELGLAARTSEPGLSPGLALGAHAEVKLLPILSVGGYFLSYDLGVQGDPPLNPPATFRTIGGRVRLTLPLPGSLFRPYGFVGVGRVGVTYPVDVTTTEMAGTAPAARINTNTSGAFTEVPFGLGLGYQAVRIIQVFGEFALRPGFGFSGDAYGKTGRFEESGNGYTLLFGGAIDL